MADYTVSPGPSAPVTFPESDLAARAKAAVKGLLEKKVLTEGLGIAPPVGDDKALGGAGIGSVISRGSPVGVGKDIFFHGSELNSGAELLPGQRPNGTFRQGYTAAGKTAGNAVPEILPMWAADP